MNIFHKGQAWPPIAPACHPAGKLQLCSGRLIEAFPASSPRPEPADAEMLARNAYLLLANHERILADSRMFLAPIGVQSGLAYSGTSGFRRPTLGVYIEWWLSCPASLCFPDLATPCLVWRLSGSPLSGCNMCSGATPGGESITCEIPCFSEAWHAFCRINSRYEAAKDECQAYSLAHAFALILSDPRHKSAASMEAIANASHADALAKQIGELRQANRVLEHELGTALAKINIGKATAAREEYLARHAQIKVEQEQCQTELHKAKAMLHAGELTPSQAQALISPIKARKAHLAAQAEAAMQAYAQRLAAIDPRIGPAQADAAILPPLQ